ncbi:hypothetical protein GCM10011584_28930 [Nocardioides phosphati]|uniref:AbiEi antitoxin C-terminal domain-containing protein n=1 Tax=Nocardioides phosphati TaxID=1867775 RepID=A0ABQ2NCA6_9ACTN|nr:hypothetical protein [Nocardioides phosphati]GGO92464.1 hypothetical protein GCM10011584_28930 [Nocardioides phosphati]
MPGSEKPLVLTQPFTTAEALAAGMTERQLRAKRFRRLHRSVHVLATVPVTPRLRAQAALKLFDGHAHVSHQLAAAVYGIAVPRGFRATVVVPEERMRRRHADIACVVRRSPAVWFQGLPVASPEALIEQLAEVLGLVDLVIAGDALLHRKLTTISRIRDYLRTSAHPGVRAALAAVELMRTGAESPQETRLRLLLHFAGLPRLETQVEIRDAGGRLLRKHDLGHVEARVAVEYQGRQHVEVVEQWESDIDRREAADVDGWRQVDVLSKGIAREPARTIQRVARALRERGIEVGPLSDEWKRYFYPGQKESAPYETDG